MSICSSGRIDRLVSLLGGSTPKIRNAAGVQLGEIVCSAPKELFSLLSKIAPLCLSKNLDTRVSAGIALENVMKSAPVWPDKEQYMADAVGEADSIEDEPIQDSNEAGISRINAKKIREAYDEIINEDVQYQTYGQTPDMDIKLILESENELLSSSGYEYERESQDDPTDKRSLKQQKLYIKKSLSMNLPSFIVDETDAGFIQDEDLIEQPSAKKNVRKNMSHTKTNSPDNLDVNDSKAQEVVEKNGSEASVVLSVRERIMLKRRHKKNNERPNPVIDNSKDVNCVKMIKNLERFDVPDSKFVIPYLCIIKYFLKGLMSEEWTTRHGSSIGLYHIFNVILDNIGKNVDFKSDEDVGFVDIVITPFFSILKLVVFKSICLLLLDRFTDFLSDKSWAPIRESGSRLLGLIMGSSLYCRMNGEGFYSHRVFRCLFTISGMHCKNGKLHMNIENIPWQARHGSLLGIKQAIHFYRTNNSLVEVESKEWFYETLYFVLFESLSDDDDDIKLESTEIMKMVFEDILFYFKDRSSLDDMLLVLLRKLWKILDSVDELNVSIFNVLELLSEIYGNQEFRDVNKKKNYLDGEQVFSKLWGFFRHPLLNIRYSVLKTLYSIMKQDGVVRKCNMRTITITIKLLFQNILIEDEDDIMYMSYISLKQLVESIETDILMSFLKSNKILETELNGRSLFENLLSLLVTSNCSVYNRSDFTNIGSQHQYTNYGDLGFEKSDIPLMISNMCNDIKDFYATDKLGIGGDLFSHHRHTDGDLFKFSLDFVNYVNSNFVDDTKIFQESGRLLCIKKNGKITSTNANRGFLEVSGQFENQLRMKNKLIVCIAVYSMISEFISKYTEDCVSHPDYGKDILFFLYNQYFKKYFTNEDVYSIQIVYVSLIFFLLVRDIVDSGRWTGHLEVFMEMMETFGKTLKDIGCDNILWGELNSSYKQLCRFTSIHYWKTALEYFSVDINSVLSTFSSAPLNDSNSLVGVGKCLESCSNIRSLLGNVFKKIELSIVEQFKLEELEEYFYMSFDSFTQKEKFLGLRDVLLDFKNKISLFNDTLDSFKSSHTKYNQYAGISVASVYLLVIRLYHEKYRENKLPSKLNPIIRPLVNYSKVEVINPQAFNYFEYFFPFYSRGDTIIKKNETMEEDDEFIFNGCMMRFFKNLSSYSLSNLLFLLKRMGVDKESSYNSIGDKVFSNVFNMFQQQDIEKNESEFTFEKSIVDSVNNHDTIENMFLLCENVSFFRSLSQNRYGLTDDFLFNNDHYNWIWSIGWSQIVSNIILKFSENLDGVGRVSVGRQKRLIGKNIPANILLASGINENAIHNLASTEPSRILLKNSLITKIFPILYRVFREFEPTSAAHVYLFSEFKDVFENVIGKPLCMLKSDGVLSLESKRSVLFALKVLYCLISSFNYYFTYDVRLESIDIYKFKYLEDTHDNILRFFDIIVEYGIRNESSIIRFWCSHVMVLSSQLPSMEILGYVLANHGGDMQTFKKDVEELNINIVYIYFHKMLNRLDYLISRNLKREDEVELYGLLELYHNLFKDIAISKIVPYLSFVLVILVRGISNNNSLVRLVSSTVFSMLMSYLPLETLFPSPTLWDMNSRKTYGLVCDIDFYEKIESSRMLIDNLLNPANIQPIELPIKLGSEDSAEEETRLRPYQKDGVNWLFFLNKFGLNGILCDDMGLGKTLQTLCMLASHHFLEENKKEVSLIVCPTSVVAHWNEEIRKFVNKYLFPLIYYGNRNERLSLLHKTVENNENVYTIPEKYNIVITSYEIIRNDIKTFQSMDFNYVVLDEGHIIKNPRSKVAVSIKLLRSRYRLILSGTPIQNSIVEFWSLFDFLIPGYLGDFSHFMKNYGRPILLSRPIGLLNTLNGKNVRSSSSGNQHGEFLDNMESANSNDSHSGSSDNKKSVMLSQRANVALEKLHKITLPFLLRRMKHQVLSELPRKIISTYFTSMSGFQHDLYHTYLNWSIQIFKDNDNIFSLGDEEEDKKDNKLHVFQVLHNLRKICSNPEQFLYSQSVIGQSSQCNFKKSNSGDMYHPENIPAIKKLCKDYGYSSIYDMKLISDMNNDPFRFSSKLVAMKDILVILNIIRDDSCAEGKEDESSCPGMEEVDVLEKNEEGIPIGRKNRALVFFQNKRSLELVERELYSRKESPLHGISYMKLDGSTKDLNARQKICNEFNSVYSDVSLLLIMSNIGGLGLNLVGANTVIFFECDYNHAKDLQSMDRAHRIGQKQVVMIYKIVNQGTVEQSVISLQKFKQFISENIVDQQNFELKTINTDSMIDRIGG